MSGTRKKLKNKRHELVNNLASNSSSLSLESAINNAILGAKQTPDKEITIEYREKRITIIYSIITVFFGGFVHSFLQMAKGFRHGINFNYSAVACFSAFLLVMLIYMVMYIYSELRCLQALVVTDKKVEQAEKNYTRLFASLITSFATAIVLCELATNYYGYLSPHFPIIFFSLFMWIVFTQWLLGKKKDVVSCFLLDKLNPALLTVVYGVLFLAAGLPVDTV